MSNVKPTQHTDSGWLENDRSGDLVALIFAVALAVAVAALLPL